MRAVILAGGKGTRLAPYTTVLPKPLVPVGERPVLEVILRQLASRGFRRVDLSVGHLGGLITTYFAEATNLPPGLELVYHWEDQPLGTAGALNQMQGLDESFLVMNGDVLTTLDYSDLMAFHRKRRPALTIALHRREVGVDLGVVQHDGGRVTDYREKPTLHFDVSMGVYVYEPATLRLIPNSHFDFPDLVRAILDDRGEVAVYPFDGKWFDIGTLADYELAVAEFEADPTMFDYG
jgi:NDP-sugar pyrophosphorylase family protein